MLKFIRGKGQQISAERQKLQKELFAFNKLAQHGFPHRPNALAWDPKLRLMAIGTRTGVIKVFGKPGVEFYGQHESNDVAVVRILFIPNQGRLITLLEDNSLHLWEINVSDSGTGSSLEKVKFQLLEGRLKQISALCLQSNGEHLLIGTEGGNIYLLDVHNFEMTDHIIYQDKVMQNVPEDYKVNPGAVEAIAEHPTDPEKILIGYNRGLLVLWDNKTLNSVNTYVGTQQLESVCWHRNGKQFISAHNDGSYVTWNTDDSAKPTLNSTTPYGPFPCKAINKIAWNSSSSNEDFIIFSGGMPRATYGDKHTVTVQQGKKHVVFDFTSRVIDFFPVSDSMADYEFDDPHSLIILVEEEIIALDLRDDDWPVLKLPYLASLHSSCITCAYHAMDVPNQLWSNIISAGEKQSTDKYSDREWPISGGEIITSGPSTHDLLLTGHEDGTVQFWDASDVSLKLLYKLSTASMFTGDDPPAEDQNPDESEWPPFRKVGCFDPYSDDPRLALRKVMICPLSNVLVIAGTAGQIAVFNFSESEAEVELQAVTMNIVSDRDNFVWKGHEQLNLKKDSVKFTAGFHPTAVLQLLPPAACTALTLHAEWSLLAAGTAHGFGLFDYLQKKTVMSKCTLNPNDLTGAGDTAMSRRKSFKKSLRESFRRLRKGRSQRRTTTKSEDGKIEELNSAPNSSPASGTPKRGIPVTSEPASPDPKPVERAIEARSADDSLGSIVRCLYLAESFITVAASMTPTLWAGTNNGAIYVFTVSLPAKDKRKESPVACQLGKEIQLKHRAPVIAISVIDANSNPLPEPLEVSANRAKPPENSGGSHRVVICSEEQFKVFTLPSLKPYCKFKLTAQDGAKVRRVGVAMFRHRTDDAYSEPALLCLTNLGDLSVYSLPDLRRQTDRSCIKREDINGISSLIFSRHGQAFYLISSCELQRVSLSARTGSAGELHCRLVLPEGVRPLKANNVIKVDEKINKEDGNANPIKEESTDKHENNTSELNNSFGEEKRDESNPDITIDSVRDHLTTTISSSNDEVTITTERREEKTEVKREEVTITQTTLIPVDLNNLTAVSQAYGLRLSTPANSP